VVLPAATGAGTIPPAAALQVDAEPKDALRSVERMALCVSLARSECALRSLLTGHKGDVTHFCGTDWFVHCVSPFVKMA